MEAIRVLIVDDSPRIRDLVNTILWSEPDVEVVGEAANGREAVVKAKLLEPDVLVMDVEMPIMGGFDATRCVKTQMPGTKVVLMTGHDTATYRREAAGQRRGRIPLQVLSGQRVAPCHQTGNRRGRGIVLRREPMRYESDGRSSARECRGEKEEGRISNVERPMSNIEPKEGAVLTSLPPSLRRSTFIIPCSTFSSSSASSPRVTTESRTTQRAAIS